ncbi:MAG: exo-alpha-sialidase [Pedosphaera sp.]|nr:exo-alpha-sialidase [Pedosphaera sp.]
MSIPHIDRRRFIENTLLAGTALGIAGWPGARAEAREAKASVPGRLRKVRDLDLLRDEKYYYAPGPSPVIFPDGEILLTFRRGPARHQSHGYPEMEACVITSRDDGKSWSDTRIIDFGGIANVNLTLLTDGTVLHVTTITQPIMPGAYERVKNLPQNSLPTRGYRLATEPRADRPATMLMGIRVRRSKDRGRTWSPGEWVSPAAGVEPLLPGYPAPLHQRSRVVQLRSGRLVLPCYVYPNPWRALLMASDDGGSTWYLAGEIAGPEDKLDVPKSVLVDGIIAYNECCVQETPSGKLVAFVRIHTGSTEATQADWPTTSNPAGRLVTADSADGGRTWSSPRLHQLWGYPFSTLTLRSGRVLLTYGYRQEPFGVRARLLDPGCAMIDEAEELLVRDDGAMRDLGYPQGAVMNDGRVFLAYYFNNRAEGGGQKYLAASILEEI